jgi:hypothetical protein
MRSQCRSFLGLELFLPLQAVLFNFSLGFFFSLLQPPVLSCFQRRELHQGVVKRQVEYKEKRFKTHFQEIWTQKREFIAKSTGLCPLQAKRTLVNRSAFL